MKHIIRLLQSFSIVLLTTIPLGVAAEEAPQMPPIPVEAGIVEPGIWEEKTYLIGNLSPVSSVQITSEISEKVKEVLCKDGELVQKGQPLVLLDDAMALATLAQAQARLVHSKEQYDRQKILRARGNGAQSELQQALANLRADEASLALAKAQLEKTVLTAPFAGKLGLVRVNTGQYITPGQLIVNLEAVSPLQVEFTIPEMYLDTLEQQTMLEVVAPALPNARFQAKIVATEPGLEAKARALKVRADLLEQSNKLKAGQFVKIGYVLSREEKILSVPESAIVSDANGHLAYKIVEGHVHIVPVKIGRRYQGRVQIVTGLTAGEQLVLSGQLKLMPNALVQVIH